MEPIPETTQAVEEYGPFVQDGDLLERLREQAGRVQALVPDCIGLSLASRREGVTFTLGASEEELASLGPVPHVQVGPGAAGAEEERGGEPGPEGPLDEADWQLCAEATSTRGVASTLTLPILADGEVVGSVNLYARTRTAFRGHHDELARIFDAWAPGAVTNADLSFSTRQAAQEAPERLRADVRVQVASGLVASSLGLSLEAARDRLVRAAVRSGVAPVELAEAVIDIRRDRRRGR